MKMTARTQLEVLCIMAHDDWRIMAHDDWKLQYLQLVYKTITQEYDGECFLNVHQSLPGPHHCGEAFFDAFNVKNTS